MKTIKGWYDYKATGSERRATFTNRLVESFWRSVKGESVEFLRSNYYGVNRALQAAVDENVQVVGASFYVDLEMKEIVNEEQIQRALAQGIANELLKCERLPIRERQNSFTGETEYILEVPIFVLKENPK